ncbi:MAG: efflux RND transporter permease subunit [Gammaproteobacteria bacterium]|nr:efflux RND transporter permease subunit [Gammaproteobacteria bacterium]
MHLRPILMSTLISVFGMLPLLLMPGASSKLYRGLAAFIVGSMSVSIMFTLILLPSLLRVGERKKGGYDMGLGQRLADLYILRRNISAWLIAVGLLGLLLWAWLSWPTERVSLENVTAEVMSLSSAATENALSVVMVRLPDGQQVRLILAASDRPAPGSHLPLIHERYADGSETFALDRMQWRIGGG